MKDRIDLTQATVLMVDDQPGNLLLLSKLLRNEGYARVLQTAEPREVEALYLRERPDLVLLDLNMPHMDGFEVMARLREIDPDVAPIIVLTAQADKETRLRALEGGAQDYVTKPFDRHEVLARIRNQLEVRLLYREVRSQNESLERTVAERTHELAESNRELARTRMDVIRRLGRACEFRDTETGAHIERMSRYSHRLALAAGMDEARANLLLLASPMHDVGKIGIPDAVLLKPGKLTPEEFEEIKKHPEIGAHILAGCDSELMQMAEMVALTHHEKWDGSGYPKGLKGEGIPLEGRIVAIADVFDALTAIRPYKKGWDVDEAAGFIVKNGGTHFDPALAGLFRDILPEILAIRAEFPDSSEG